jgi:formylglycine-generating enzyme required for sulfatase activity
MKQMKRFPFVAVLGLTALSSFASDTVEPKGGGDAPPKAERRSELAKPMTLQQYIDRYSADYECTIGGQTFRNFKVRIQSSLEEEKLKGDHPSPPFRADQIMVTPVNYIKDGRRWIGFHFTNTEKAWEVQGGPHLPKDFKEVTKAQHDYKNCGFTSNYDIRMEVHGTEKWERGKVAYENLSTARFVDGKWDEIKNVGPGSRGNLGWYPRKINGVAGYGSVNPKTPQSAGNTRLCSISLSMNAPHTNENWIQFLDPKPNSFEVRTGYWPEYIAGRLPGLYTYGIWFRVNCWDNALTRWRADYVEYSFSNPAITDEVWTADGTNKAPKPAEAIDRPDSDFEGLPVPKCNGETLHLELAEGVKMKFALIPAGKFVMGTHSKENGRWDHESPQHIVTISKPFYMGVHELTYEQIAALGNNDKKGDTAALKQIKFQSAVDFCKKLSQKLGRKFRLPTEAEWEYACRAGTRTRFSFGDDEQQLGDYAWFLGNAERKPHSVGEKKPNPWGLYDMHGNVWEWCSDWYSATPGKEDEVDPTGPKSGDAHVLRGGAWSFFAYDCRSASRIMGSPGDTGESGNIGFRIVCEAGGEASSAEIAK